MRSTNRPYMPAVDHLRALAAGLVVIYHGSQLLRGTVPGPPSFATDQWVYSGNPVVTFIAEGHTGVALFMVLSGFILTTGSLGREISYRSFLRNRVLRVVPLYVLLLMIAAVTASGSFSLSGVLQTVLGFGTLPGGFTAGPFAMILWTIGVELQFYLVFPLFLRILDVHGCRPLLLFIVCMGVLRALAALTAPAGLDMNQMTYFSIVGRIDQFLIGMLAAYLLPSVGRWLGRTWQSVAALGVVVLLLWAFNQVHGFVDPSLLRAVWVDVEAAAWAGVVLTYVGTARFARGRLSAVLAWTGERSYGTYLLHMPVIYLVSLRGWQLDVGAGPVVEATLTALLLVLPVAVALATLTFAAVERPFLALRRRYVGADDEAEVRRKAHAGPDGGARRAGVPLVPVKRPPAVPVPQPRVRAEQT